MLPFMPHMSDYASKVIGRFSATPSTVRMSGPARIAIVTTVPQIFHILTGGRDPYAASRVSITPFSIKSFLEENGIEGLDATLFFVPALTGEWSQTNPGSLSQLESALNSGGPYNRVINVCHAIPLYRRSRLGLDRRTFDQDIENAGLFGDTLVSLAAISRQLEGRVLEPREMGRIKYATRQSLSGLTTISDSDRDGEWIKTDDPMWADPTGFGLSSLDGLHATFAGWADTNRPTAFNELLGNLGMSNLLNRFIYSEFERDFDRDTQRLWDAKGAESPFSNTEEIFELAVKKHTKPDVQAALRLNGRFLQARADLQNIIAHADAQADDATLKMIDISSLIGLDHGAVPEDAPRTKAAARFMKDHDVTVAFQQSWDRNAYRSEDVELNAETNAWYISNGLLVAKQKLKDRIPKLNLWAVPVVPTNSVRFVLNPAIQRQRVATAMVNGFSSLAELQLSS